MHACDAAEIGLGFLRLSMGASDKAMPTAIDFRNFADACTRLAKSADTEANKTALQSMAMKWAGLATQAERIKQLVREADAVFDASGPETDNPRPRPRPTKAKVEAGSARRTQAGAEGADSSAVRSLNS
jgi:hypothetical protein